MSSKILTDVGDEGLQQTTETATEYWSIKSTQVPACLRGPVFDAAMSGRHSTRLDQKPDISGRVMLIERQ